MILISKVGEFMSVASPHSLEIIESWNFDSIDDLIKRFKDLGCILVKDNNEMLSNDIIYFSNTNNEPMLVLKKIEEKEKRNKYIMYGQLAQEIANDFHVDFFRKAYLYINGELWELSDDFRLGCNKMISGDELLYKHYLNNKARYDELYTTQNFNPYNDYDKQKFEIDISSTINHHYEFIMEAIKSECGIEEQSTTYKNISNKLIKRIINNYFIMADDDWAGQWSLVEREELFPFPSLTFLPAGISITAIYDFDYLFEEDYMPQLTYGKEKDSVKDIELLIKDGYGDVIAEYLNRFTEAYLFEKITILEDRLKIKFPNSNQFFRIVLNNIKQIQKIYDRSVNNARIH